MKNERSPGAAGESAGSGVLKALVARLMALALVLLPAPPAAAQTEQANPSLWHVTGPKGEAWLFGSVHVLTPDIAWRTPAIQDALAKADVFVFEVPQDAATLARVQTLVARKGFLPAGVSLRDLLHPAMQARYDAAVAASGLPPAQIDRERPWLAGLQLLFAQMGQDRFGAADGADTVLMDLARRTGRPMRYLETIDEQFALLAPDDPALELDEFESGLSDLEDAQAAMRPLLEAWKKGDQQDLARIVDEDMADFPQARKALFDQRNARWVPKIEAMLKQKHRFFITVGAGHLAGPRGVPALLRQAGYQVEGP